MAIIKLWGKNPSDGTSTFTKVKFYEATDDSGTGASLIATEDVDLTTADSLNQGYTTYTYTSGDTAKYYATAWDNDDGTITTDYSTWVKGGEDRLDERFKEEMEDTAESVWTATQRKYFKDAAIDALHPELYFETIDTSLSITNNSTTQTFVYTLPYGIFDVNEVSIGYPNKTASQDRDYKIMRPDYWSVQGNKLVLDSLSGLSDGYPIRIVAAKKYTQAGEIPERIDRILMLHMRMDAYLNLADDYPRFKKWAQMQDGTKVSFENLRVQAREYEQKFAREKQRIKEVGISTAIY